MTYLVDTCVVSELRKSSERINAGVLRWSEATDAHLLHVSVLTIMELEVGAGRVARRDRAQGELLEEWLVGQVLPTFDRRILPVDLAVARRAAALQVPDPRPAVDCLLAATAEVHGLTIVTRNVADFDTLGVAVTNPWS